MATLVTHIVRRRMGKYRPGQCVDPSDWRNTRNLEVQNHITPIPATVKPKKAKDGTLWVSAALADAQDARSGSGHSLPPVVESGASSDLEDGVKYPVKVERGVYRLSDGTTVQGSLKTAKLAETELEGA